MRIEKYKKNKKEGLEKERVKESDETRILLW